MKCKIITMKELLKNNQRVCLSVKRSINKCYDCKSYENCESKIINKKYESKIKKIKRLNNQINKLQEEIKKL